MNNKLPTILKFRLPLHQMKTFIVIVCYLVLLAACSKDTDDPVDIPGDRTDPCDVQKISFVSDVKPVIDASCATSGCHGASSLNGPGPLVTYSQIFNARSTIQSAVSSGRMPIGGSLSASSKSAILCWINNGAPEN
jgi:hypothetical protein